MIAESGIFPAAETVEGQRYRNRNVNANHANFDPVGKSARRGTILGEEITRILKWSKHDSISPLAELLLFNSSRAELVSQVIKPALCDGITVICDRYVDSTIVYQGRGRGLSLATVRAANDMATQGLMPDLTILLDMPVEQGQERKRLHKADRIEQEALDFHQKVRDGYLALSKEEPSRWLVVNADQPKELISDIIWTHVKKLFHT